MDLLFPWRQQRRTPRPAGGGLQQNHNNDNPFLPPLQPDHQMMNVQQQQNGGIDNPNQGAGGGGGLVPMGVFPRFWNEWNGGGPQQQQQGQQVAQQPVAHPNGAVRRRDRGGRGPIPINDLNDNEEEKEGVSPLRQMLDALNMAIFPHDLRLSAVLQAAQLFDHRDRTKHDNELRHGAARIIYQKLAVAITLQEQQSFYHTSYSTEGGVTGTTAADRWNHDNDHHSIDGHNSTNPLPYSYRRKSMTNGSNNNGGSLGTNSNSNYAYHSADSIAMQRIRSNRSPDSSDADYEIALLTSCLEMVHRATPHAIESTWNDVGCEALPILIKVMERPFAKIQAAIERADRQNQSGTTLERAIAIAVNRETKTAVQKVTKVLAVYSLVPDAKIPMATCPGLLSTLVKITDTHNMNRLRGSSAMRSSSSSAAASIASRRSNTANSATGTHISSASSAVSFSTAKSDSSASTATTFATTTSSSGANGIRGSSSGYGLYMNEATRFNAIATLTNLAAAESNRMIMLAESNLVNNIARVVHNERSDVARRCSALAIMNLSTGDSEYVPELAGNDLLLETLIKLLKDDTLEVRRNAAIALFNVACADQNTVKLVQFRDGAILEIIIQLISNDDYYRGSMMGTSVDMNKQNNHHHLSNEVRVNAAEALFNISCSSIKDTTDRVANHQGLLESLAITLQSPSASRDVKKYCATILRRMAEIIHAVPSDRKNYNSGRSNSSHQVLLNALVKACVWSKTPCIADAFLLQAKVPPNRVCMIHHHGLLNALSKLALNVGGGESDRVRSAAVSAIEYLALDSSSRALMARNEGIMMALTRASYGQKDGDSGSKDGDESFGSRRQNSLAIGPQGEESSSMGLAHGDDDFSTSSGTSLRIQDTLKNLVNAM